MKIGKEFLYLSQADVRRVGMHMKEYIDILERAHRDKGLGQIELPPKLHMDPHPDTFIEAMACSVHSTGETGTKWLSGCAANKERGLPRFTGFVILNDPQSGAPYAVMDCTYITGMRTAGVSGVALRHLANPDSEVFTVLGCGLEGRTHLEAVLTECPRIRQVYAWGPRQETVEKYVAEMRKKYPGVTIEGVQDPKAAVRQADILACSSPVTHGDQYKIIEPDWLKPGVTAVPINTDSHFKPAALKCFHKIYIDDRRVFEDNVLQNHYPTIPETPPELGDLLCGRVPGRERHDEKIVTFTGGIGLNDITTGRRIVRLALEQGIGTVLPL